MSWPSKQMRNSLSSAAKSVAYLPTLRNAARNFVTSDKGKIVRAAAAKRGLTGHLNRYMSETLPAGHYFAKLTIADWKQYNGQSFRLFHGDQIVYGNEIEPPARGFPLEYRNFVVRSPDVADFHLDIDSDYSLQIGHGAFSTPQQRDYDERYGVRQHGNIFYSLRGNTSTPKKLLVTFPGFGPSTSRISYAVSYMKDLSENELADTLMICFQDRYLAAGSYMLVDNAGRSIVDDVNAVIAGYLARYDIDDSQLLMFGASKGGSIAVQYADQFPNAHLLLVVPQMHLRYYLNKPFFRNNLFMQQGLHDVPQPESLLRRYLSEGRTIHYFYTHEDEQSNFSLIETVADVDNLVKYRFDGKHGDVARKALPTMLGVIRNFLRDREEVRSFSVRTGRIFQVNHRLGFQARIEDDQIPNQPTNWYLEGRLGRTRFMQSLSDHQYPFVKYTNEKQLLSPEIDDLVNIDRIVALGKDGSRLEGDVTGFSTLDRDSRNYPSKMMPQLRTDTSSQQEYVVISHDRIETFRYISRRGLGNDDLIEIYVVGSLDTFDLAGLCHRSAAKFVAAVEKNESNELLDIFSSRLHIISACEHLSLRFDSSPDSEIVSRSLPIDASNSREAVSTAGR